MPRPCRSSSIASILSSSPANERAIVALTLPCQGRSAGRRFPGTFGIRSAPNTGSYQKRKAKKRRYRIADLRLSNESKSSRSEKLYSTSMFFGCAESAASVSGPRASSRRNETKRTKRHNFPLCCKRGPILREGVFFMRRPILDVRLGAGNNQGILGA